ncbi:tetratricopeptide repeat protein [Legionella sp. 227]|uniref:tetratricopeptide repeat protein n=1 Tax=Legionella sp. 227 TaxID=3367288 RepID=UPI00370DCE0E
MPFVIKVSEDNAVQYSPDQSTFYRLHPEFDKSFQTDTTTYEPIIIDPKEEVILESIGIHHCHTVIVKDRTHNNFFMLHVSPQALRRPYDPVNKLAGTVVSTGMYGMFSMNFDASLTNSKKPAYIDLDPHYYGSKAIGTHPDSELEVIVVVNAEYWNVKKVQQEILETLQERIPGKVVKSNVIINNALEHAYYYSTAFDPKSESLTVISRNGLYTEPYKNAFDNNVHQYTDDILPEDKQMELRSQLKSLQDEAQKISQSILESIDPYGTIEQFVLKPSNELSSLMQDKRTELEKIIKGIEAVMSESKNPVLNLGSPTLYETYKQLGFLHLFAGNYEQSVSYFSKVALYAANMSKAEFDDDKSRYAALTGAIYERLGDLEQAYIFYKDALLGCYYRERLDADLRFARVASQLKGKEVEALEAIIHAKNIFIDLIDRVENQSPPKKEEILNALKIRGAVCDTQLSSLKEHLIEHHHESPELQQEFDKHFALSTYTI